MFRRSGPQITGGGIAEVLKIALPLILSSSCHAVNMFTDRLMLAHYSQTAVAAAFTGGLTNFTISCLFVGTIGYTGTFVAQYEGANRRDRIGHAVWQGVWLALLGSLILGTGVWWAGPLFSGLGHEPHVVASEVAYFQVLSGGICFFMLDCALSCFWTGRGKTAMTLAVSAAITAVNVPLNYLLIFGKCGFPELGVTGAAWGTVLAELVGSGIYLAVFLSPSARRHFCTGKPCFDLKLLLRMLRYGLPNGANLAADLAAFNIFTLLLGSYGVAVHEAASITFGINNIAFCPVMGVGMTASILMGQAIGAENVPLARKSVKSCLVLGLGYTLVMVLGFTFAQDWVLAPFVRHGDAAQLESLREAGYMLYFIAGYLFFDVLNITLSCALRGAGDTRFTMFTMLAAGGLAFALPCLVLHHLQAPWWSLWVVFDLEILLLATAFLLRYRGGKWTKMRVIEVPRLPDEPAAQ